MTTSTNPTQPWYDKTGLVIFLCIFLFPVGLYALWRSSKYSKGWKVAGTAIIGLFVILVATDKTKATDQPRSNTSNTETTATEKPAATKPSETAATTPEDKSQKYLFVSADDFKDAFNKYCSSSNQDFSIDDLTVTEGEVQNVFKYMLTDHLSLLGTIRKADGNLIEVTMIGTSDGTFKSGSDMILCMISLIATVDPGLEPSKRTDVLKGLHILDKKADIANLDNKTTLDGFKYSVSSSKEMGLWFSISRE